ASVAEDVEPEYIAVSSDSLTAWVALQENNALAILDLTSGEFTSIEALGFKDHLLPGNELDASNKDDAVNIANWPVKGMYQPDGIAVYEADGETYVVTANEGDARDYDGFSEEARVKDLLLGGPIFAQFGRKDLQANENLGRLKVTTAAPSDQRGNNGCYHELYSYGTRSFSIFTAGGELVFDSGSDFETIMADPDRGGTAGFFNSSNEESEFDARSDDKGPEPEAVVLGEIDGQTIAFVGLERQGGVMIYDITDPTAPVFQSYVNNRNFDADPETAEALDLGPEGLKFIPAGKSPSGNPLLVTANEISGTTTIFEITVDDDLVGGENASANDAAIAAIGAMDVLDAKANAKKSGNSAADKTAQLIASLN
ncbi:MAG: bifunctional metallophosphatase/5'-nucleotidase, partial [Candidatus Nealsonbacteria bacterium]|nr:bifunctional metallophosphatase/5'-nucleotidase [Candidatus Nealsonbacteria bacterium]